MLRVLIHHFLMVQSFSKVCTSCSYSNSPSEHLNIWHIRLSGAFDVGIGGRLSREKQTIKK